MLFTDRSLRIKDLLNQKNICNNTKAWEKKCGYTLQGHLSIHREKFNPL